MARSPGVDGRPARGPDLPGRDRQAQQQVARILFDERVPIRTRRPEVPDGLAAIIPKALAKAPADRFADADVMKDALAPFAKPR